MRQYKYLFLISFLFFSIFAHAQRIKPSSRIEKATDSTYILLSDIDGKYQHTKLVAESGISFNISNDTIYISATGGGTSGVSSITGGLGIDPDGSNTGAVTLSFDPTEFGTLSTLDGNEDMWGYSSVIGQPVKYDIQGVFSNVLNDQANGIDFTESGTNQINVDLDLGELPLGTTFDGAFLLLGNYGTSTERTTYFQHLLKNTLTSTDGSVTFTDNSFTLDLSASGGGGGTDDQKIDTFDIVSNQLRLSLESDGEAAKTVDLSTYLDNTDAQTLSIDGSNNLSISGGNSVSLSAYDMNNFNIQADGGTATSITDNETINFDAGTNMTISRVGNTLTFDATSGGGGVSSITGGNGLDPDAASTGAVTMSLDLSELALSAGYDYNDFLVGTTSIGTESRTNVLDMFDNVLTAGSGITLTNTGTALQIAATGGGGGMTSWTARADDGGTFAVNDSYILDFDGLAGIETTSASGDINIALDGDEFIDGGGSADGSYYLWTWKGVITYRETIQNLLNNVLTSTDGSVTIGTSGNSVNLTTSGGGTDGDANWDDTSVYLSASGGADISSTTISSTHSDKRNFNVSLNAISASTSNTQLLMPSASSTYRYHIFTVSCADNSATYNCQISNTVSGTYNMTDGELVVLRASQYEGSWTWFVN